MGSAFYAPASYALGTMPAAELEQSVSVLPSVTLVAAFVERGIKDYLRVGVVNEIDHGTAVAWFLDVERQTPWGFNWCCDVLGLNAEQVRKAVKTRAVEIERRLRDNRVGHNRSVRH